ncbi:protein TIFY 6B-like [Syzygium oleosum]|uniref:protein TIFY 6B-like n=1 Tax=Syzygium oleosum TaxID=219896 RepID=UPI0011D1CC2F|nr:protein TIFY 6B-like [Syzygium oleosum]
MERDFLGLSAVKEETGGDACGDSESNKGSPGMRWPFLNKVSAVPHRMSFKAAQDEKTKKVSEPIVSSGLTHLPVADAYDSSRRRTVVEVHSSFNRHRQGGSPFSLTSCSQQSHPRDARVLPLSNQGIPASMGDPFFKTHFAATGQTLPGGMTRQKPPGGVLVSAPNSDHLTAGSTMGTAEPWKTIKPTVPPSQLTIFYAGTVNVYDNISPEKAQAIMFLARNGVPMASKTSQAKCFVQAPTAANSAGDHVDLNQPTTQPFSSLSSPLSVSSHPTPQSQGGPAGKDESKEGNSKVVGTPSKLDAPKMVSVMGSIASTAMVPSAIPQARKASLARFLEKRKERVMSVAPYNLSKNSPEQA